MDKLFRIMNVLRKRKLGVWLGMAIGLIAFLAVPFSFSLIYTSTMQSIAMHLHGLAQAGATVIIFTVIVVMAIFGLTLLRAGIAQIFRCRWYRTR